MNRTTPAAPAANTRFGFCDLLRAMACLMVFWDHNGPMRFPNWIVSQWIRRYICAPLGIIQDFGNLGGNAVFPLLRLPVCPQS